MNSRRRVVYLALSANLTPMTLTLKAGLLGYEGFASASGLIDACFGQSPLSGVAVVPKMVPLKPRDNKGEDVQVAGPDEI